MSEPRQERHAPWTRRRYRWLVGFAVAASLVCVEFARAQTPALPSPDHAKVEAGRLFELGLEWAIAERYQDAVVAFDLANRLAPHPDVTFNLALALIEVGRWEEARGSLLQYLGNPPQQLTRRNEAEALLDKVNARLEQSKPDVSEPLAPVDVEAEVTEPPSRGPAPSQLPLNIPEPSLRGTNLGSTLMFGTGVVLVGTGAGLWLWNWRATGNALSERKRMDANAPDKDVASTLELERVLNFERERARTQARLDLAPTLDWVAASSVAVGVAILGVSIYLGFDAEAPISVTMTGRRMEATFVW